MTNNSKDRLTEAQISKEERLLRIENEDKKEDAQRRMTWYALFGMLLYPIAVVAASSVGLDTAVTTLGTMAAAYFVSVAGIVMAFFGAHAWKRRNNLLDE